MTEFSPEVIPYSENNPWYLQSPDNLPEEWIGLTAEEMEERIGDMISMGHLVEAGKLITGPVPPIESVELPRDSKDGEE